MDNIEIFDRYIDGELSEKESREFQDRLKTDKEFAMDFEIYCLTVIGVAREAEQDNKDFEEAMKRISKEELLDIIGERKEESGKPTDTSDTASKASGFKKWLIWQSIGVAALLGIAVIYIVIARNETDTYRRQVLAMNQESANKMDEAISTLAFPHDIARSQGDDELPDVANLSDDQLKQVLPKIEKEYNDADDEYDRAEIGNLLVMSYVRLHEREKAKKLLETLISDYKSNEDFNGDVENWQTILRLLGSF